MRGGSITRRLRDSIAARRDSGAANGTAVMPRLYAPPLCPASLPVSRRASIANASPTRHDCTTRIVVAPLSSASARIIASAFNAGGRVILGRYTLSPRRICRPLTAHTHERRALVRYHCWSPYAQRDGSHHASVTRVALARSGTRTVSPSTGLSGRPIERGLLAAAIPSVALHRKQVLRERPCRTDSARCAR